MAYGADLFVCSYIGNRWGGVWGWYSIANISYKIHFSVGKKLWHYRLVFVTTLSLLATFAFNNTASNDYYSPQYFALLRRCLFRRMV